MRPKIVLDYDPRYQGIIQIAAWGFLACFAIFVMQFILLATNTVLLTTPAKGEWDQFLPFGSRLVGLPLLGLFNAALTGVFFVIRWRDMRRFTARVAPASP